VHACNASGFYQGNEGQFERCFGNDVASFDDVCGDYVTELEVSGIYVATHHIAPRFDRIVAPEEISELISERRSFSVLHRHAYNAPLDPH